MIDVTGAEAVSMSDEGGGTLARSLRRRSAAARLAHSTLVVLAVVGALWLWAPGDALALECGTKARYFQGTIENHGSTRGAQAKIDYVNESVCSPVPADQGAFSSYWVAVIGSSSTLNIYQIGVDKCRAAACPPGVPVNTPYYFYAYGRKASTTCGPAVGPEPVQISGTPSGLRTYTIVRGSAPSGFFYYARIDGSTKNYRPESTLATCWGAVDGIQILNETYYSGSQVGGPTSNYQDFQQPKWYNGSLWTTISRPNGSRCDLIASSNTNCRWSVETPNTFKSWDERF